ncbi:hypothetical protein CEXT_326031, partial [Caerostris extrusa]
TAKKRQKPELGKQPMTFSFNETPVIRPLGFWLSSIPMKYFAALFYSFQSPTMPSILRSAYK